MKPIDTAILVDLGAVFSGLLRANDCEPCCVDGQWMCRDPELYLALKSSFDPKTPALAGATARVKEEAQRRIFAVMPAHKQTNLLALATENMLAHGPDSSKWPADMQAVKAVADAGWAKIKEIRSVSNAIEARLAAEQDWQTIADYDPSTDPLWPK